jgi:hypothetical protein
MNSTIEKIIANNLVKNSHKLSCLKIDLVIAPFKFIEFFQNGYWQYNIVIIKVVNALMVMKNHIRIDHKYFCPVHGFNFLDGG